MRKPSCTMGVTMSLLYFLSVFTQDTPGGWDGGRNNGFVQNGYHDNRMNGGNRYNSGPPRMERGRGGGGFRGGRGGSYNPVQPMQNAGMFGVYDNKDGGGWNTTKDAYTSFAARPDRGKSAFFNNGGSAPRGR